MFQKSIHYDAKSINDLPNPDREAEIRRIVRESARGRNLTANQERCAERLLGTWLQFKNGHFDSGEVAVLVRAASLVSLGSRF